MPVLSAGEKASEYVEDWSVAFMRMPILTRGRAGVPAARGARLSAAVEPAAIVLLVSLAAVALEAAGIDRIARRTEISVTLALVAGAVAMASAVLAAVALGLGLDGDHRLAWLGAASALYALVAIPATSVGAALTAARPALGLARLMAHLVIALMLLVAFRPPRDRSTDPFSLLLLGMLAIMMPAALAVFAPDAAQGVSGFGPLRVAVVLVWTGAGVLLVLEALRAGAPQLRRIGTGVTLLALAHGYRVLTEPEQPVDQPGIVFSLLRLLAVGLVLVGLTQLAKAALRSAAQAEHERDELLATAREAALRVAERNHELRNGLAVLGGVAHVLGMPTAPAGLPGGVRGLAAGEVARLNALLGPGSGADQQPERAIEVEPLLRNLATLRRLGGMDVDHFVHGTPRVAAECAGPLNQVLTNVVANCARHAPGSPVRMLARERRNMVRISIIDVGPGVPAELRPTLFDRGARGAASSGQGLGLHICRELLESMHGTISVTPTRPDGSGCTVTVAVPAAPGGVAPWGPARQETRTGPHGTGDLGAGSHAAPRSTRRAVGVGRGEVGKVVRRLPR